MKEINILNDELNRMFDVLNEKYFGKKLNKPMILVQTNMHNNRTMGWCTTKKIWKNHKESEYYYEISISAEYLCLGIENTMATLLHESVHLFCQQFNIKDTSRENTYHNKRFKEIAEKAGLIVNYDKRIGWSLTTLKEETKKFINEEVKEEAFILTRQYHNKNITETKDDEQEDETEEEKTKSSTRKYVCPCCGTIIRATKEVNVICGNCRVQFEEE